MASRIPCTPPEKKMKIAIVEQGILRQELAGHPSIVNSTVSDIIYGCNQCKCTRERIVETFGTQE